MNNIYQEKYLKYKKKYFKLRNQIGGESVCKSNINNGVCGTILEASNKCSVKMQDDGNLVVYDSTNKPLWASNTNGKGIPPYKYIMQGDGNLVIYDYTNNPLWASNTDLEGISPYKTIIQEDCNFVLYDSTEKPLWSSKKDYFNTIEIQRADITKPKIAELDNSIYNIITIKSINPSNKLIVFFSWFSGGFSYIGSLSRFPGHIIYIRDIDNNWYNNIHKIIPVITKYKNDNNIVEMTLYGISMGGTGALIASKYFQDSVCIALTPQLFNLSKSNINFHNSTTNIKMESSTQKFLMNDYLKNSETYTYIISGISEGYSIIPSFNIPIESKNKFWGDLISLGTFLNKKNTSIIIINNNIHTILDNIDFNFNDPDTLCSIIYNKFNELKTINGFELIKNLKLKLPEIPQCKI
jgi:hypothetical protein